MEPWQDRVIEEKAELDARIEKLADFIVSARFRESVEIDQILLKSQRATMREYSRVLGVRIANF